MRQGAEPLRPGLGEDDRSRADRCLGSLVSHGGIPSLAYAVVRDGDATLGGFGGAGPQTIFEIGSVTKVFTALLLADMAERGQVRLSDPAARYLSGGTGPVTLADLATRTSGLPRLPRGLRWSALTHPQDPYVGYRTARLVRDARRSLRASSRPNAYAYSNYGYGLLGYLLARAAGSSYQALVTERICGPLGLADTTFEVPQAARDRRAQGHARGRAVSGWHMGALAGAGGLHSTAADLAKLLRACLAAPAGTPLDAALRATMRPRADIPYGQIGLAWHLTVRQDRELIWHNGMTGGYSAMVAFDPVRSLGVAALANAAGGQPSPVDEAVVAALG
jgi:D-alanyl-D-alanine-carboxypeptidase/D-alanyl-D-alanine-endopeptidase